MKPFACSFGAGMKKAFDRLAYFAVEIGRLNLEVKLHQAVRVVLHEEFAPARLRVLIGDPLNRSGEFMLGQRAM